jgi:peptidoglycan/LPS O-acetylase OafA/YrhL
VSTEQNRSGVAAAGHGASAYRSDIDGLRAVAVIPVVLFHAGYSIFSGGFVGVDVFFVISGYLITGILYREALEGRFSIARFYERRVRRIFPALFALLAATLVAGLFILLPNELAALGRSAIAATLFVSNIFFWRESGYFDAASITKPLLHTWSLAVEEQFYIFFPPLIWAICRWKRSWLLPIIVIGALASLVLSVLLLPHQASATFYLIPTRAWELLIGSALALLPSVRGKIAEVVSALGLLAIVASVLLYREAMPFPGLAALPPCLGAGALILCARDTWTGKLLSAAPMRAIGLISFSLYLWHWPVLVYARFIYGDILPPVVSAACVLISTAAAAFSWRFIEQPFRKSRPGATSTKPLLAGLALLVAFSVAGLGLTSGLPGRLPAEATRIAAAAKAPDISSPGCFLVRQGNGPDLEEDCLAAPPGRPKVLLWGDSHANQFAIAIRKSAASADAEFRQAGRAGCPPLAGLTPLDVTRPDPLCGPFNDRILKAAIADPSIKLVILAGRWSRFTFPAGDPEGRRLLDRTTAGETDTRALFFRGLGETVKQLRAADKQVILIADVPEFEKPLPECMARAAWHGSDAARCAFNAETLPGSDADHWLTGFGAAHQDLVLLRPMDSLCPGGACSRTFQGLPISSDQDHLTESTAQFVISQDAFQRAFYKALGQPGRP